MELITKIGQIFLIIFFVLLWNKYIVTFIVKRVASFHKKYNKKNINKQPIKFVMTNELKIIKFTQYLYWFGAIIISYGIIKG